MAKKATMQEIGGFFERLDAVRKGEVKYDPTLVPEDTPFRNFGPCENSKCNNIPECFHGGHDPVDCVYLKNKAYGNYSPYRNL